MADEVKAAGAADVLEEEYDAAVAAVGLCTNVCTAAMSKFLSRRRLVVPPLTLPLDVRNASAFGDGASSRLFGLGGSKLEPEGKSPDAASPLRRERPRRPEETGDISLPDTESAEEPRRCERGGGK